jgi:hypothetical protein
LFPSDFSISARRSGFIGTPLLDQIPLKILRAIFGFPPHKKNCTTNLKPCQIGDVVESFI